MFRDLKKKNNNNQEYRHMIITNNLVESKQNSNCQLHSFTKLYYIFQGPGYINNLQEFSLKKNNLDGILKSICGTDQTKL